MNQPTLIPLAERMRPRTLSDFIGQKHLLDEKALLRQSIEQKNTGSIIFWGPPGVGKTTLSYLIAQSQGLPIHMLSAISSGVQELRQVIEKSKNEGKSVLFIDEIHRFNKNQQDALLGAVEKGIIQLIGATTENPSFEVNSALLSRSHVYILKELSKEELDQILQQAIEKDELLSKRKISVQQTDALIYFSGGDARKLLNLLELLVGTFGAGEEVIISNENVTGRLQKKMALYDKKGEQHYDIISAFIKSMRGSDPNAAVYWLARMLDGGEDIKFIARRMLILASEDIGNANPNALLLANNCFQAINTIGMPEARIILSQTAVYLACSAKSNASYLAIDEALSTVKKTGDLPVPLHLRNAPTKLMKELDYGKNYQYAHSFENNFVDLEFLPERISGTKFFEPNNNLRENEMRQYLKKLWKEKYKY
ncbi:MAG: replication-associated recombination protein A [Bacteroidia bacterium]|nr:replication-associated recombination protein A [Bacteroidia bacterium]MBP7260776.1 replication-associated recombination protein A [Bacteroidia bacterium]MBP9180389.1 replication-associated recombination protein A [Bacteroidia bacterium]MBP9724424.1 replication-associated recombination protein A [Bacteroidia bacterium]